MNIAILSHGGEKGLTGINKVTIEVTNQLLELDNENTYCLLESISCLPLNMNKRKIIKGERVTIPLNYVVQSNQIDIVHSHYFPFHISDKTKCAKILTIHDLNPYIFPEWYGKGYEWFDGPIRRCAEEADKIITVSEYTKRDVIKHFNIPEEKIKVIYNGLSENILQRNREKVVEGIPTGQYILSVSALDRNKNQKGLLQAFSLFKEKYKTSELKLVLTGPSRNSEYLEEITINYPAVKNDVIFTGYVSEEELIWLYANAFAFIYPSFHEGFGLPILEAMSFGKAVICSNTTSMPEVGGDAVEYCDPYNIESIAEAMEKVFLDENRKLDLEERALAQASKFSYEKAAKELMQVYNEFK